MAFRLSSTALETAVRHLGRFGDTDVFPHLPELAFLSERRAEVVAELEQLDLDVYAPGSAIEAVAPKSRFGFRIVHQMPLLETVLLLASVVEIGPEIEGHRPSASDAQAFSYRFGPDSTGRLFKLNKTYKDWLHAQVAVIHGNLKIKQVIATDISDFYARLNFHRLENLLDEVAPGHGAARFIKKHIKAIRAKQSFGLPVGGSAARLLAELALIDSDRALEQEGWLATRFVDDYRIFLNSDHHPYDVLAYLAEQLAVNEGLSLNAAKTSVMSRVDYLAVLKAQLTEVTDEAAHEAFGTLTADLYFDDEPDQEKLETLKSINLLSLLQEEVGRDAFDMGRIKLLFRALKLAKPLAAIDYIAGNFSELVVFAKEIVLLMQVLEADSPGCFDGLGDEIVNAILSPPASSIQVVRTWLLELFVRGTAAITTNQLKLLERLPTPSDKRQLHLIRGRLGDKNFFRKNKAAFDQLTPFEQPCFAWAASCLPKDEYETWAQSIKLKFNMPLGGLFLKWAEQERPSLISKLDVPPLSVG